MDLSRRLHVIVAHHRLLHLIRRHTVRLLLKLAMGAFLVRAACLSDLMSTGAVIRQIVSHGRVLVVCSSSVVHLLLALLVVSI